MKDSDISDRECLETVPFDLWGTECLLVTSVALSISSRSRGLIGYVTVLYVVLL